MDDEVHNTAMDSMRIIYDYVAVETSAKLITSTRSAALVSPLMSVYVSVSVCVSNPADTHTHTHHCDGINEPKNPMTYQTTTAIHRKKTDKRKWLCVFIPFARVADAVIHLLHGQNEPVTI